MKKLLFALMSLLFLSSSSAQDSGYFEEQTATPRQLEPLKLSSMNYLRTPMNIKDKFILLSEEKIIPSVQLNNEASVNSIEASKVQGESTKIGNEIFYFLGAAVLAAVIYFIIPENSPAAESVYTFGFPVTPK